MLNSQVDSTHSKYIYSPRTKYMLSTPKLLLRSTVSRDRPHVGGSRRLQYLFGTSFLQGRRFNYPPPSSYFSLPFPFPFLPSTFFK